MIQEGHLQAYALTLTTRSPLFIGSGLVRNKTDYLFNPRTGIVQMLNMDAFFQMLAERNLADDYERFVLSGNTNLFGFLKDCSFSADDIKHICLYQVNASDALDADHSLKEIHTFQRNAANQAYVPGSSIKGALRTVLLCAMMEEEQKGQWPYSSKKSEKAQQMASLEGEYLNTLNLRKNKKGVQLNDAVNSILRGISISDSLPIPDKSMILAGKFDANPMGEVRKLPLCRECAAPGTKITFRLTLDQSVLKNSFQPKEILDNIQRFVDYYQDTYSYYFKAPREAVSVPYTGCMILGGGSGFFAKNLAYPWWGEKDGLDVVQKEMIHQFRKHGHENDAQKYDVSPHMMKYAKYQGKLYPYGLCEVAIK